MSFSPKKKSFLLRLKEVLIHLTKFLEVTYAFTHTSETNYFLQLVETIVQTTVPPNRYMDENNLLGFFPLPISTLWKKAEYANGQ